MARAIGSGGATSASQTLLVFASPLPPAAALGHGEAHLRLPRVRVLAAAAGLLPVYRAVTGAFPVRGHLVPDAHRAVLLRQHDVQRLYAAEADFRKFAFLEVRDPHAPAGSSAARADRRRARSRGPAIALDVRIFAEV
jgi:hypothetical protein